MHLTDNIPNYFESIPLPFLGVSLSLIIVPLIVMFIKAHLANKKNITLQKQYVEDMQHFNKLPKKEKSTQSTPTAPVDVSLTHPALVIPSLFLIFCGFVLSILSIGVIPSYAPRYTVVTNIQSEAKRVYNLHLTSDEAEQLSTVSNRRVGESDNSVLATKDSKADYIELGSLGTGVKKDGETKVLKIMLVRIDGEYKLVYEGKAGLSTVQEIPKA